MSSKQRVLEALDHREPDRIPVDFGATAVTGIHVSCVAGLRERFGLEKRPVKVHEPHQMLGWVDEDLKQALGLDVEGLLPRKNAYGFVNENWKSWRTWQGLEVLVPGNFNTTVDAEGYTLMYPEGDVTAAPSGKMPQDGYFFDAIIRQAPIEEDKLDPEDNLEEFGPISEEDLAHIRAEVERAAATGRAVIAKFSGMGLGDIAAVPAPFLKRPRGIRDITEWYVSTRTRRDYIHAIFSKQTQFALANLGRIHTAVGNSIDVLYTCGTDFGTQRSTFCSAETFRDLYLPYYKLVNGWVHKNTTWKTFKHSCGAVGKFMSYFIEAGFDIINPVQCSAAGMEAEHLKNTYGDRLVFWGGGVDTQKALPFGTPAEVREQVLRRCEIFAKGGGFVFNAVHNIQAQTPVANILAMLEAVREFRSPP
jgi:hypothetical protein